METIQLIPSSEVFGYVGFIFGALIVSEYFRVWRMGTDTKVLEEPPPVSTNRLRKRFRPPSDPGQG